MSVLNVGIDIGSTTVKVVAIDPVTGACPFSTYRRHHAAQLKTLREVLSDLFSAVPGASMRAVVCGSGGESAARILGLPYVQEVVANSIAIRSLYPQVRTAIELGGQDAKAIFFSVPECNAGPTRNDEGEDAQGQLTVSDMRMNGSCAGGTGAFIDEIAALLHIPIEQFNEAALRGSVVYDVSGRCGVYAKTDIQPLINQGVSKDDLALSSFHAIAKQTIGGLAQGLEIKPPVIFEGGPLTFNTALVDVFVQRLGLEPSQVVIPKDPQTIIALGAALSLDQLFAGQDVALTPQACDLLQEARQHILAQTQGAQPLFASPQEREDFMARHAVPPAAASAQDAQVVRGYLGIDSGSTTTKFALIDQKDQLIDAFYSSNQGDPLQIAQRALLEMHQRYAQQGRQLEILGVGTTGYGELLFNEAFQADFHVVETVAHAAAAQALSPDVSFILDIGGQDMKAMWIEGGVITNIVVNEACSSGCGSFLESFASGLGIPVIEIAEAAFRSQSPAQLGSRCTVFMNSSIVTEQRNGKTSDDIMAGLCRSIIENVFTKVIRISNLDSLGQHIVVQGGTFQNDAVLRAFEQYVGRNVVRAPHAGLMGAIGVAMLCRQQRQEATEPSTFIGFDALEKLTFQSEANVTCPWCANHCNRTRIRFSNGSTFFSNIRCSKGQVDGSPKSAESVELVRKRQAQSDAVPNLFSLRERLLFQSYDHQQILPRNGVRIGIPRVLSFWETAPFWRTFWESLGYDVVFSGNSTRAMYESGLSAVTSDTVCFPAKLVHGHIRDLAARKVDKIFMPTITTVPSQTTEKTSVSMCAVVKGYSMVIRNSDNPQKNFGIPFVEPLFHWYVEEDRNKQLGDFMESEFGVSKADTMRAIAQADAAQNAFSSALQDSGAEVIRACRQNGTYAVVLASRPYQNDALVNHDLPQLFTQMGIPVLTADSVPGCAEASFDYSRIDIVNNYHARMISSAMAAAQSPNLEYVQIVSFGCGHDAYLTDEIIRIMKAIGNKAPLALKVDESDIQGPLRIRVRSFIQTVNMRRAKGQQIAPRQLKDAYPQKLTRNDCVTKTVLVPNTSHAFGMMMAAALSNQGVNAVSVPIGRKQAIELGKQYVHNDICFPCQMVIGELLAELKSGKYDLENVAVAQGKYIGDCRLTHYTALTRKALDDAGFENVPILTNDDVDRYDVHPGFRMSLLTGMRFAFSLPMIDALEELLRKMRPYELVVGSANAAFEKAVDLLAKGLRDRGINGAKRAFKRGIELMRGVAYDRSSPRPTILVVGEYLLNFHPGANNDIEDYLERNGFEVIEARMTDVIRKSYFYRDRQIKEYDLAKPFREKATFSIENNIFELAHDMTDRIACAHPLYEPATRMPDLVKASDSIIHHTFDAGEGVLIPGEILHHAAKGCRNFVILQPFGCLPNHVVGRGIAKRLKELYPDAQILPLDYDPDVSFANIENRLQMLIMGARRAAAN